ncbi:hypothetical protein L596_013940 [Steinernema carpocapsae]|uniref:Uncharacterized protein n=1 Tax=Steinernema carpocapsae TaxID=34508 RepID=A0A4U5NB61_STECR|nr:hypothetical protein L596_013940 [Steinernema carpocapsae]
MIGKNALKKKMPEEVCEAAKDGENWARNTSPEEVIYMELDDDKSYSALKVDANKIQMLLCESFHACLSLFPVSNSEEVDSGFISFEPIEVVSSFIDFIFTPKEIGCSKEQLKHSIREFMDKSMEDQKKNVETLLLEEHGQEDLFAYLFPQHDYLDDIVPIETADTYHKQLLQVMDNYFKNVFRRPIPNKRHPKHDEDFITYTVLVEGNLGKHFSLHEDSDVASWVPSPEYEDPTTARTVNLVTHVLIYTRTGAKAKRTKCLTAMDKECIRFRKYL